MNLENITLEELSKKTLADLRTIAKELNIKSVTKYKKNELVELINDNCETVIEIDIQEIMIRKIISKVKSQNINLM